MLFNQSSFALLEYDNRIILQVNKFISIYKAQSKHNKLKHKLRDINYD